MTDKRQDALLEWLYGPGSTDSAASDTGGLDDLLPFAEALAPVPASDALLSRIESTTERKDRFSRFASLVAAAMDVDEDAAGALLSKVDEPEGWSPGFLPGMMHRDIEGGPAVASAITGFVRLLGGTAFPEHEHLGEETVVVIQGRLLDGLTGKEVGPGEVSRLPSGTSHAFRALEGPDLVYLVVVQEGLSIGGQVFGPNDAGV